MRRLPFSAGLWALLLLAGPLPSAYPEDHSRPPAENQPAREPAAEKSPTEKRKVAAREADLPFTVPEDVSKLPRFALLETTRGPIEIMLYRDYAPLSVANFEYLGRNGIYNGVEFHRLVPGFVIQGGDPTGTKKGGPGWTLPPEMTSELQHLRGTVGWARLDAEVNPERRSNGSQFYICLRDAPDLDGFYTVFGRVIQGMPTVEKLRVGDKILAVRFPLEPRRERFQTDVRSPGRSTRQGAGGAGSAPRPPRPELPAAKDFGKF